MEWILIVKNVTSRSPFCEKLRKKEEIYRIVMKQTKQLVYEQDIENGKIFWLGATRELMGCELEDLESVDTQVWLNQIHPEECNKIWEDFGKYLEKGENFQLEYRLMEANKNYIWVEEDVVCLKDENGNEFKTMHIEYTRQ